MSGIISGISAFFQAIATALGMAQAKEQRNEGATAQNEATNVATLKTLEVVSAPVPTADSNKLWDDNAKKFGPGSGTAN